MRGGQWRGTRYGENVIKYFKISVSGRYGTLAYGARKCVDSAFAGSVFR